MYVTVCVYIYIDNIFHTHHHGTVFSQQTFSTAAIEKSSAPATSYQVPFHHPTTLDRHDEVQTPNSPGHRKFWIRNTPPKKKGCT